ncbi:hypothetical protein MNV49_006205 [Pseudohyphozyma bogoriensis]|nr:hypothetical protein MNV49_006205 [Pseudohyphozyma bogoriensis]
MSTGDVSEKQSLEEQGGAAKAAHIHLTEADLEHDNGQVTLFADANNSAGLKLAKDGRTILIPQPSDDPRDPLNWPEWKKMSLLLILAFAAYGGDFQSGAGIPLINVQGEEWNMTATHVNEAGNLNVLFLGIGGMLWIPPIYFWGRLPCLFWSQFIGTFLVLGSCLVTSFQQYYVLRPLTSVFLTAGQVIGLTFIRDMYFFHEHAKKIGIWVCLAGLNDRWRPTMWLVFALSSAILVAIIFLGEETYYNRSLPEQPHRRGGVIGRIYDLTGVTAYQQRAGKPSIAASSMRVLEIFTKPVCVLVFFIYALSYSWAVGINITSSILFAEPKSAGGYGFGAKTISFLYFTPLVALITGELFGHWANDFIATRYAKKHANVFRPEARLFLFFLAAPLMMAGLVLCGQALQKQLTVACIIIGWGMYVFGVMTSSVGITAYVLDAFPSASGEVSSMINMSRTVAGFSVGYYQLDWGLKSGFDVSFGVQAAIVGFAMILTIFLVIFGERLRKWGGALHFAVHDPKP